MRIIFASLITASLTTAALAGNLNPPGGPVLPTMKTIQEAEPRVPIGPLTTPGDATATFIIGKQGSYYLTANVSGENLKHGIRVDVANVSIDLRGFTLLGVVGSSTGISVGGGLGEFSVSNGIIRDWSGGVAAPSDGVRVSDIVVVDSGFTGFSLGNHAIVSRCRSFNNGPTGIRVGIGSVITKKTGQ